MGDERAGVGVAGGAVDELTEVIEAGDAGLLGIEE
jgi:hypothetical protein